MKFDVCLWLWLVAGLPGSVQSVEQRTSHFLLLSEARKHEIAVAAPAPVAAAAFSLSASAPSPAAVPITTDASAPVATTISLSPVAMPPPDPSGPLPDRAILVNAEPRINNAALLRGIDELAISQVAMMQATDSSKSASSSQQELTAKQAETIALEPYSKVKAMVPEARAQLLKVRKYALLAAQHRDHTLLVEDHWKHIKEDAAETARKAVLGWIKADASKTAARGATVDNRADRLAAAVAAAAEPYHLALLRNQKFCEETYSKAKTAQKSCQKLITDAKKLSLQAQPLQAAGLGIQARELQSTASGMMLEAENLRQWGNKLYSQANTACSAAGGYTMAEQQAATNAAMTTIMNAPMKLPPA